MISPIQTGPTTIYPQQVDDVTVDEPAAAIPDISNLILPAIVFLKRKK